MPEENSSNQGSINQSIKPEENSSNQSSINQSIKPEDKESKKEEPKVEDSKKKKKKDVEEDYKPLFSVSFPTEIPDLPDITEQESIDVKYKVIEPYVDIRIYWDSETHELKYQVIEPELNDQEKKQLEIIEAGINELINISFVNIEDESIIIEFLEKNVKILITELGLKVDQDTFLKYMYYIWRDFVGMDLIEPLMRDYFIEDVECNGIGTPIYIIHRKYSNLRTNIIFEKMPPLVSFVEKLAQKCSQYVSYANPLLDGSLPDGSRVNATYTEDVTSKGPTFCIADGHIQFNNGAVKKIDEFFEESKKQHGYKVEDNNEIVDLFNVKCCGVNGEDLTQLDANVKTVIKLAPPDYLTRVKLDDGSDITVTLNHKFHVIDESGLKLIDAENLSSGMIVPVPSKVNVMGCSQKINVYNLLKDFSYINNVCLKSEIMNKELALISCSNINNSKNYYYEFLEKGNSMNYCLGNPDKKNDNFKILINDSENKKEIQPIAVPSEVNEDLAYLVGIIFSNGKISNNQIKISIPDNVLALILKNKFKNLFDANVNVKNNEIFFDNKFVPFFLNHVFKIPYNNFKEIQVPEIIFKSENKVISSFIKGLFEFSGELSYESSSKDFIEGLSYLFSRLGIFTKINNDNNVHNISIPKNYISKYFELINLENSSKNSDSIFEKNDLINIKPLIEILDKKNMVCLIEKLKSYDFDYLPRQTVLKVINEIGSEKDLAFFKWMIECNQEYVKIKSVDKFKNIKKIPVYDVELEPCKFFIGGNKPLNMFDTIRKFTAEPWTPIKLMDFKTVSPEILAYIWLLIEHKSSLLVIGGTGSGKTSLLNAIGFFIPPASRIVSIEDTRELNFKHDNWLPAVARAGVGQKTGEEGGHGAVTLFDLLKESLRQRPDYIIVGEIRGKEAYVMFQAMASGHPSMATMHAESVDTVVKRLVTPPISLSPALIEALDAVCFITPAKLGGQTVRRLKDISEIVGISPDGNVQIEQPFVWQPGTDKFLFKTQSKVFKKVLDRTGMTWQQLLVEFNNRSRLLFELYKRKIFDFGEVQSIIHKYYKVPDQVLQQFGIK